ncbi:helix-turn-helix domain-containing protein [Streptomyces sp. NPDC005485]|uniref:TetR/AcrR family transcriptional regulator n=1 Tax=Streptomyces sp. NPDC005485 TaxID=3155591 RepID=UPI0033AF2B7E
MGHRDALLQGAKQCLAEKGYARTTARDIVAASGTNLASIGYHYGSKEALLNEALIQANIEWGEALKTALARGERGVAAGDRTEALWTKVTELFGEHRGLWAANFEAITQAGHSLEVRAALARGMVEAQYGLGDFVPPGTAQERDESLARAVGLFHQALITGVMAQWLIDPESAPTGRDLSLALQALSGGSRPQDARGEEKTAGGAGRGSETAV